MAFFAPLAGAAVAGATSTTGMAIASLLTTVAGTGMAMAGQAQQGAAARAQAQYQAAIMDRNRQIAERSKVEEGMKGENDALAVANKARALRGAQEAAFGASGVDIDSDSAQRVMTSSDLLAAIDQQNVRFGSKLKQRALTAEAEGFSQQAQLYRMQGENASQASKLNMASTFLGGASSFGDKWMKYRSAGVFT